MNKICKKLKWFALPLASIGAINWGLIGFFNYNLVESIFSTMPTLVKVIYSLVGLSGLYLIYHMFNSKN